MEEFFPSEIARLVLGYLEEMKCKKSWQAFINESSNLSEYFNLCKKGKVYSTNVNGKSLLDILQEYCNLEREALKNKGECSKPLENSNPISKEDMEKIIKSAVDHAFQQFLPSICKGKADDCVDNGAITANEAEKMNLQNGDLHGDVLSDSSNEDILALNDANENFSLTSPQLSITDVISLSDIDSKEKTYSNHGSSNALFKNKSACMVNIIKLDDDVAITNPVINTQRKNIDVSSVSSKNQTACVVDVLNLKEDNGDISVIDPAINTQRKNIDVSNVSSKIETACVIDIIKLEDDDDCIPDTDPVVNTQRKDIDVSNAKSTNSCNVSREFDAEKKFTIPLKNPSMPNLVLSNIQENADLSLRPVNNMELGHLFGFKSDLNNEGHSDHNIENDQVILGSSFHIQNSVSIQSTSSTDNSNLEVNQNSSLNPQLHLVQGSNIFQTSQISDNQSASTIDTNSFSNQCGTVLPLSSSVPTYFVSNFPSNSCFMQNNAPYHFVINSPLNGLPVAVPQIPVKNISSMFTATDLKTVNGMPFIMPSSGTNVPSTTAESTNSEDYTVIEKENPKRKNDEEISERKVRNNSEASYTEKTVVSFKKPAKKKATRKKSAKK